MIANAAGAPALSAGRRVGVSRQAEDSLTILGRGLDIAARG